MACRMRLGERSGDCDKREAASSTLNLCNEAFTLREAKEAALTLLRPRLPGFMEKYFLRGYSALSNCIISLMRFILVPCITMLGIFYSL